ncbi:hypothetical protein [Mesorhizobium sp.]|nr:hypothetical protein [Mesorhizobium sp.]
MKPYSQMTIEELVRELAAIRAVQAWRRKQREAALLAQAVAAGMTA